ncbi:dihydrodipicolinate synthase family protein [Cellulomonas sp. PhB150]|uniref:dihydrodipicolinate synthase family protein n=1 Tax=Cellulomonas sp. PhB150 TaxID=2485188 RepID=UPI000F476C43|nr:dihydrodipicolinate synthase family protein [Cellulomonas sp. PhB150]ROS30429.1 4-hydroxy-tetrahydrodipicolinate synthase [Cellulomonas sp. PhB150]
MVGPLVAYLPTPRTEDGQVAPGPLQVLVDRAVTAGVDGLAVLGSAGGFAYLDRAQRERVVRAAAEAVDGRVPLLAGIGALTTAAVLEHSSDASAAGADALLLGTTAYLPLTPDEVVGLFREVAGTAERPVWIYHNPRTTGVEIDVQTLARIAHLPGIGGTKDRGTDAADVRRRYAALSASVPAHVEIGFSGDLLGVHGLLAGARTWHCGLAGLLPEPFVAAAAAAVAGDSAAATAQLEAIRPWLELSQQWGIARLAPFVGRARGIDLGTVPRPLLEPPASVLDEVERLLSAP